MNSTQDFYEHLFADASRAGVRYLHPNDLSPLIAGAQAGGCLVFQVDLAQVTDKAGLLNAIAKTLAFPEWFGANWDALNDLLLDMGWRPALGYLVQLNHAERVHALAQTDFITLMRIFGEVADTWRANGVPFWCLVDIQTDGIDHLPTPPQAS